MSWQVHLDAIDKKQAQLTSRQDEANQILSRLEEKVDLINNSFLPIDMVEFTVADFEPIDGVGPATAQKIVDIINAKQLAALEPSTG